MEEEIFVIEVVVANFLLELSVHGVVFGNFVLDALLPLDSLATSVVLASLFSEEVRVDRIGLREEDCAQENAKLLQE